MAVVTLLDAAKKWARERDKGYLCRWIALYENWMLRIHLAPNDDIEIEIDGAQTLAKVRRCGLRRARTPNGLERVLDSIVESAAKKVCKSSRHTDLGCPACGLLRRNGGRRSSVKPLPKLQRVKPVQVLPPDEVPELAPESLRLAPRTVEEAEAELERLMRQDAPPEALRAAGARLDKLLEKRPLN